jgi:hypothetical protein
MKILFLYIVFLIIVTAGCKEKYLPVLTSPDTGYLVVEGYINSGQQPTGILLSRTTRLYDSVQIKFEHNAEVNVEGENRETFPLYDNGDGVYISPAPLNLNSSEKYRLKIRTQDNKEYVSDFIPIKHTPAIDSISWQRENGGLKIYVNTHDPQNNTRYYQWKYEETWEIHSAYKSILKYKYDSAGNVTGITFRNPFTTEDTTIYKCWTSYNSKNLVLGSSEKLSTDRIYLPVVSIEPASEKLSVLYSIHVRQYALSHEAYLFLEKIKKNTEQVGSIFDAQPSELQGNIHCTSNPSEIVVGYIDISEEKEQRIFISNEQVPGWNYTVDCPEVIINNDLTSIRLKGAGLTPTIIHEYIGLAIKDFYAAESICVDCTLRGTNVRPAFWP